MLAVKIVTDSTSYLPEDIRRDLNICTVSLGINFELESYREVEIDNDTFYKKMSQSSAIPTSSQPAPGELYSAFEDYVKDNHQVLGIFISSLLSGTYSAALATRNRVMEKYPHALVEVLDSGSCCMEMGFAVLAAARAAREGLSLEQVLGQARRVMESSRFLFVPDSLEYLRKGGRIGGAAALLGTILQIRPVLSVVEGKTSVLEKVRTKARAVQHIMETFYKDIQQKGLQEAVVHHINNEAEGNVIAKKLEERLGIKVPVCSIGPVVGLHVGPGTVGMAYYTRDRR